MLFWLVWHNNEVYGELLTQDFDLYTLYTRVSLSLFPEPDMR